MKEQGLTHSLKKASSTGRKRKKNGPTDEATVGVEDHPKATVSEADVSSKVEGNIKNQDTAALTAKVLAEQEERNKRRKLGANENVKSLFSSKNGMDEKHLDFMTRGFTIPANAKR